MTFPVGMYKAYQRVVTDTILAGGVNEFGWRQVEPTVGNYSWANTIVAWLAEVPFGKKAILQMMVRGSDITGRKPDFQGVRIREGFLTYLDNAIHLGDSYGRSLAKNQL